MGWMMLLASPVMPILSDRIAGYLIPAILSAGYVSMAVLFPPSGGGGFGSLGDVVELFGQREQVLIGWVHFLAFDLVVGAWICRTGHREGMRFLLVMPSLPLTFLFGPAGFLMFAAALILHRSKTSTGWRFRSGSSRSNEVVR